MKLCYKKFSSLVPPIISYNREGLRSKINIRNQKTKTLSRRYDIIRDNCDHYITESLTDEQLQQSFALSRYGGSQ
jgi:hypothetical protein